MVNGVVVKARLWICHHVQSSLGQPRPGTAVVKVAHTQRVRKSPSLDNCTALVSFDSIDESGKEGPPRRNSVPAEIRYIEEIVTACRITTQKPDLRTKRGRRRLIR